MSWLKIILTPQVALLTLQYFCFSFVWYFYITWLPTYLREARRQSAEHAAILSVLPLLFGGVGSVVSGVLPLKIPRRWIAFLGFLTTAVLLVLFARIEAVVPAMLCLGLGSFASDLTMPISWNACVEIGGTYTATVSATMNMLGNSAGFVAPTFAGFILQRTGNDWNPLIYCMAAAACVSASCWLALDPDAKVTPHIGDTGDELARALNAEP